MSGLVEQAPKVRGVRAIEPAGSLRRRKATIGDLDLLAATDDPVRADPALDSLTSVERVLSAGTDKSSIVLADGPQVDLMVCPPAAWGSHLVHFTGSKEHNVALRGSSRAGSVTVREGLQGGGERGAAADRHEEEVTLRPRPAVDPPGDARGYQRDPGRLAGSLPAVVDPEDLRGDTHVHSDWTDGVDGSR